MRDRRSRNLRAVGALTIRMPRTLSLAALVLAAISGAAFAAASGNGDSPVTPSAGYDAAPGFVLFISTGCGACHTIRGTEADGEIGPDLTHLAARRTIGAAMLPLNRETLLDWVTETQHVKPGARMPSFGMLPDPEAVQIVDYLMTLE